MLCRVKCAVKLRARWSSTGKTISPPKFDTSDINALTIAAINNSENFYYCPNHLQETVLKNLYDIHPEPLKWFSGATLDKFSNYNIEMPGKLYGQFFAHIKLFRLLGTNGKPIGGYYKLDPVTGCIYIHKLPKNFMTWNVHGFSTHMWISEDYYIQQAKLLDGCSLKFLYPCHMGIE